MGVCFHMDKRLHRCLCILLEAIVWMNILFCLLVLPYLLLLVFFPSSSLTPPFFFISPKLPPFYLHTLCALLISLFKHICHGPTPAVPAFLAFILPPVNDQLSSPLLLSLSALLSLYLKGNRCCFLSSYPHLLPAV